MELSAPLGNLPAQGLAISPLAPASNPGRTSALTCHPRPQYLFCRLRRAMVRFWCLSLGGLQAAVAYLHSLVPTRHLSSRPGPSAAVGRPLLLALSPPTCRRPFPSAGCPSLLKHWCPIPPTGADAPSPWYLCACLLLLSLTRRRLLWTTHRFLPASTHSSACKTAFAGSAF